MVALRLYRHGKRAYFQEAADVGHRVPNFPYTTAYRELKVLAHHGTRVVQECASNEKRSDSARVDSRTLFPSHRYPRDKLKYNGPPSRLQSTKSEAVYGIDSLTVLRSFCFMAGLTSPRVPVGDNSSMGKRVWRCYKLTLSWIACKDGQQPLPSPFLLLVMHLRFALSFLLGAAPALGLSIPFKKRDPPHSTWVKFASTSPNTSGPFDFLNTNNNFYTGVVHVDGFNFTVQLDTGSSDLWLDTSVMNLTDFTDTGVIGAVTYADGGAAVGEIILVNVTFGDFTVNNQALINAPGSNATVGGILQGILGIGPTLSQQAPSVNGATFLDNVFSFYPDEPNFMTFLLSRDILGVVDGGDFTIGEVLQGFEEIQSSPQLKVLSSVAWITFMDAVIINGQRISGHSFGSPLVKEIPDDKTIIIPDTGTSFATAPQVYVDAMYKDIPGSTFADEFSTYIFPCDAKVNITMVFGDREFPMHPIDATIPAEIEDDGSAMCIGSFSVGSNTTGVDFILGDSFMRNVYSLFDFGNLARVGDTDPFIQLLSVTDSKAAFEEFDDLNNARIQAVIQSAQSGNGTSSSAVPYATSTTSPSGTQYSSPQSTTKVTGSKNLAGALEDSQPSVDLSGLTRNTEIIMGLLGAVIVLLIGAIVALVFRGRRAGSGEGYKPVQDPRSVPLTLDKRYSEEYKDTYTTPYAEGGH
ncbi:acid protease [Panus rudis PR-1116 ss-1]|nr:acid protease [Panus rudis PR-1116 ss-1]